jgi:predicted MPP superfamily phosphohydrolase
VRLSAGRVLLIFLVVLLASALLAAAHYYLAESLILDPGVPDPWRTLLLMLVFGLGATLILQPIGERRLTPPLSRAIAWAASLWMGLAFLLLIQLMATEPLLWLAGCVSEAAAPEPSEAFAAARAALVAGVALVAGGVGLRSALRPPRLERVEVTLERWPRELDGFRVAQVSDTHIGPILGRHFAEHVVAQVNALDADLVALTGDLVDGAVHRLAPEVAPFARLRARHGVFFVTGNHDHLSGVGAWCTRVQELGIRVLRNERVEIRARGAVFDLVGVDDHHGRLFGQEGGEDLDAALAGRDPARPALLLAHDPSTFKRASGLGIDLQLSGHTHGGQLWPFRFFVRLAIPFVAGRYRRGGAELYVSRGTGFWGPAMRLGAPAEITEIVLRSGDGDG